MPAAIAIPAIIGAGASIGSAAIASRAAGKAANTQSAAAERAAQYQQQMFNQATQYQQQLMAPYLGVGQASASTLGRLMGLQPSAPASLPGQGAQMPTAEGLAAIGAAPMPGAPSGPAGSAMSGQPVMMQGSDGSIRLVPPQMVDMLTKRGAHLVRTGYDASGGPPQAPPQL